MSRTLDCIQNGKPFQLLRNGVGTWIKVQRSTKYLRTEYFDCVHTSTGEVIELLGTTEVIEFKAEYSIKN